jgi:hypothetical protein
MKLKLTNFFKKKTKSELTLTYETGDPSYEPAPNLIEGKS